MDGDDEEMRKRSEKGDEERGKVDHPGECMKNNKK